MPIESIQQSIHIRKKKNEVVFRNIARLHELSISAQSHQDILDGLHPWNDSITLKFENNLPIFVALIGICFVFSIFLAPQNLWMQLGFLMGLGLIFYSYLCYEPKRFIDEAITTLEETALSKKYHLQFQKQPQHISVPLNPLLFISQLKQMFPLFERGSVSNEIYRYASTVWQDEYGQEHQVLLFQYQYIDELQIYDKNGNAIKVKETKKDLWGAFVFDVHIQGLAVTTSKRKFYYPYSHPWHSSDIRTNNKINFYGSDPLQTAKLMSPSFVLRLYNFFQKREGDLLFHPEKNILCYLGTEDLFKTNRNTDKIQDISALRGHLRTFRLVALENLQKDLTQFLE